MTLRQHGLSDLHLDFCVSFLINILEENLDLKVQHKNIMNEMQGVDLQNLNHRNARTSVDLRFNRFIFLNLL